MIEKLRIKKLKEIKHMSWGDGAISQNSYLFRFFAEIFFCFQQRQTATTLCVMWNKQSTHSDWWCSELQKISQFWDFKVWNRQWTFKIYGRLNFYIILHEFYDCFLFWDALLWEGFLFLLLHVSLLIFLCAIFVWSESNFLS